MMKGLMLGAGALAAGFGLWWFFGRDENGGGTTGVRPDSRFDGASGRSVLAQAGAGLQDGALSRTAIPRTTIDPIDPGQIGGDFGQSSYVGETQPLTPGFMRNLVQYGKQDF